MNKIWNKINTNKIKEKYKVAEQTVKPSINKKILNK